MHFLIQCNLFNLLGADLAEHPFGRRGGIELVIALYIIPILGAVKAGAELPKANQNGLIESCNSIQGITEAANSGGRHV